MIMKNKRFIILSGILLISLIFVSSYNMGKRSETIIIPNKEESQIDDDQKSGSFQVKKIYRLPQADQLLGWSSSNSVVGFSKEMTQRKVKRSIFRMSPILLKNLKLCRALTAILPTLSCLPTGKVSPD